MKMLKVVLVLVVVVLMFGQVGCASSREVPTQLTDAQIADAVEYSYASIGFMKSEIDLGQSIKEGDLSQMNVRGGHELTKVVNISARNATKTAVYNMNLPGPTWRDRLVIGFSVYNGSLQEYYPNESNSYNEYPSPYLHGTDQPHGYAPQNCLIGLWTYSWVGVAPDSEFPPPLDIGKYFHNVLSRSVRSPELEAEARKMGKDYIVFHKGKGTPANEHIIYIARRKIEGHELFLVEKWDTIDKGGDSDEQNVTRTRDITYHTISYKVPTDINWKLWDSNLLLSKK